MESGGMTSKLRTLPKSLLVTQRQPHHQVRMKQDNWRKMYGPPPNCKKKLVGREQSAKMYPAFLLEIDLRALDDDAHVPVLLIATVVKDLVTPQVLRHVV